MSRNWQNVSRNLLFAPLAELTGIIFIIIGIVATILNFDGSVPATAIIVGSILIAIGSIWNAQVYDDDPLLAQLNQGGPEEVPKEEANGPIKKEYNKFIGAIDQGTTGTRFMIFDHSGEVVANAYKKHEQIYPEPGWVEHDPMEIWENTKDVVTVGLDEADLDASNLEAIGITNQRETTIVWDKETGKPVHNALVWQDRRTTDRVEEIQEEDKMEWIREKTGLECDAHFSATKTEWILDNTEPLTIESSSGEDVRKRAEQGELLMGTIDTWIIYNLTGNHITDVSNASRTMLYNIRELEWDDELLEEFNIPKAMTPEVRPSSDERLYGHTDQDGFLSTEVPVAGALGDQQAALFGQACFDPGDATITMGTGTFILVNTGSEAFISEKDVQTTIAFQISGEPVQYALENQIFMTPAFRKLEDFDLSIDAARTAEEARSIESTEGVYMIPPSSGSETPVLDYSTQAKFVGTTDSTGQAHLIRAVLESIVYQIRTALEDMLTPVGIQLGRVGVDGSAAKNHFICQFLSNILSINIFRPDVEETTALGAAQAAGIAVGFWDTLDELRENRSFETEFEPETDSERGSQLYNKWTDAVAQERTES